MDEAEHHYIYVIDDDAGVRATLEAILVPLGYKVRNFTSAVHFLAMADFSPGGCVLADVRLPGMSGLDLQEEIGRRGLPLTTIVITGHADVGLAVRAMKAGALDFLEKPFDNQKLIDLLPKALQAAEKKGQARQAMLHARALMNKLTTREREVALLLSEGLSNKLIAHQLSVSPRTVEIHRSHLMDKLGVSTVACLIKILSAAGRGSEFAAT